jgi:threonine dehydrogenase-like Zn-dependent dehydrogenase
VVVLGLGPIGEMCTRVARHRGAQKLMAVDLVPERLERARRQGVEALNLDDFDGENEIVPAVRDLTDGRGPDAVIDAVGMEAHGRRSPRRPIRWWVCCPPAWPRS